MWTLILLYSFHLDGSGKRIYTRANTVIVILFLFSLLDANMEYHICYPYFIKSNSNLI